MPTYNCGPYIEAAIASVQRQAHQNFEIFIVDDCSTDDTRDRVEAIRDERIHYHQLPTNSGAAVARTRAMELARGRYIAFLDSDDLWTDDKLKKQLAFMRETGYPFTCTAYDQIDGEGKPLHRVIRTREKTNYNGVLLTCPVGNSSVMYDVEALGKFTVPDIKKRNDDALWLKMLKATDYIYGMPDVLMHYRIHGGSISNNKLKVVKYHWQLYREIEHLSIPRSAFHIGFWALIKILHIK